MKRKYLIWITIVNTITLSLALIISIIWFDIFGKLATTTLNIQSLDEENHAESHMNEVSDENKIRETVYDSELIFLPEQQLISGTTRITARNNGELPTDKIYIHLFLKAFNKDEPLPVLPEFVKRTYPKGIVYGDFILNNVEVEGQHIEYHTDGIILEIRLEKEWEPNQEIGVLLKWQGEIPEINHRIGRHGGSYWFGNILPTLAVYDNDWHTNQYEKIGDPFYTEVSDYNVRIQTPANYEVIATGNQSDQIDDKLKNTTILAEKVRDFAFAITSQHKKKSVRTSQGIDINFYYHALSESQVNEGLRYASEMVDYMEQRVGKYPYQKLDLFENDMFISGMEYPGIVFLGISKFNYSSVVHEVAHQWFYNVIGNNPLMEPWLDEAFATYFTDEYIRGDQLEKHYLSQISQYANDKFMIQKVYSYDNWSSYFSGIYRKGSIFVFEIRKLLGEDGFNQFIKNYYDTFQYKIVTKELFEQFVQSYTEENVSSVINEWIK